jgi:hypothetical protein
MTTHDGLSRDSLVAPVPSPSNLPCHYPTQISIYIYFVYILILYQYIYLFCTYTHVCILYVYILYLYGNIIYVYIYYTIYTYTIMHTLRVTPQPPYEPERTPSDGEHIPSQFSMCYTCNRISVDHFYLH